MRRLAALVLALLAVAGCSGGTSTRTDRLDDRTVQLAHVQAQAAKGAAAQAHLAVVQAQEIDQLTRRVAALTAEVHALELVEAGK